MTTVRSIIESAQRKIGVVAIDEPMTADQAEIGLSALNAMMFAWALYGVDVSHATLAIGDDFPLAEKFVEGTIYMLARKLAPDFGTAGVDDDAFFRALQAAYLTINEVAMPTALLHPYSRWIL
jgi:hypothetical protein